MRRLTRVAVAAAAVTVGVAGQAFALSPGVKHANKWGSGSPPVRDTTPANKVLKGYQLKLIAQGTDPLENPSGEITNYGYLNDAATLTDGTKTEPDQNLFVVFPDGLGGPTPGYDYGTHFLFQGHENGGDHAYITRINLDVADPAHRITLMTPEGADGLTHLNSIDGSMYDPYTGTALFTQEAGSNGGVIELAPDGSSVTTLYGQFGRGGYEGIHASLNGDVYLAEDAGGVSVHTDPSNPASPTAAKQPNSFIYRYKPYDRSNLDAGGTLQALQVEIGGHPVLFHAGDPVGDTFSTDQLLLNSPGDKWSIRWVTVHDTKADGTASFDANAAAKTAGATPFKRPENLAFQPGTDTRTFFFAATGDTNSDSGDVPALAARGAWGTIFKVHMNSSGTAGTISVSFLGDADHNSFDNITWAAPNKYITAEDRGDGLHQQLNTLDSVWQFAVSNTSAPQRLIALGRDPQSLAGGEDNEPTGFYVSNGKTDAGDMYGTEGSLPLARGFFTQQHGENQTFEVLHNFK